MKKYIGIGLIVLTLVVIGLISLRMPNDQVSPIVSSIQPQNQVVIDNYEYKPAKVTVKRGTTVVWLNKDIAQHTVTSDEASLSGPNGERFGQNEKYEYTFNTVGVFAYHCEPHPYMKGLIEVVE